MVFFKRQRRLVVMSRAQASGIASVWGLWIPRPQRCDLGAVVVALLLPLFHSEFHTSAGLTETDRKHEKETKGNFLAHLFLILSSLLN